MTTASQDSANSVFPPLSGDRSSLEALGEALRRLRHEDAVSLPWLSEAACRPFLEAADRLTYREARPVVGSGDKEVRQDFEVCMALGESGPFHDLAAGLERDLIAASTTFADSPLPAGFTLNDMIVQRYPVGCRGITPHVDHIRYEGLVAILVFAGRGKFEVVADRSGADPRHIPNGPGDLLLMAAPGYGGQRRRPFHRLSEVSEPRVILGLRWDVRDGEPW